MDSTGTQSQTLQSWKEAFNEGQLMEGFELFAEGQYRFWAKILQSRKQNNNIGMVLGKNSR